MSSRPPGQSHKHATSGAPLMNLNAPKIGSKSSRRGKDAAQSGDGSHKRQKIKHSPQRALVHSTLPAQDTPRVVVKRQESSSSDQSASKWFDNANKHIESGHRKTSTLDEDPPFYIGNRPNYVPTSYAAPESERLFGGIGAPSRMESENEDLRSVIDDLTVENKRLKQLLRAQHRQQQITPGDGSQNQLDRLFEVRIHGLPSEKKKELEYLLTNFATSLHQTSSSQQGTNISASASRGSSSSNQTATRLIHTDSGYESVSGSAMKLSNNRSSRAQSSSTPQAVRSYLHDIPDALLPRRNPIMSEKTKMELAVRRLEQLFTGRKAAPGDHDQPMQQQEVSHSAARAEQLQSGKPLGKRKPEGAREAHVLPPNTKINLDALDVNTPGHADTTIPKQKFKFNSEASTDTGSGSGSPDQRPTRPLDLDIYRAQVSFDNIEYIRHLGMPSPHIDEASTDNSEGAWMFLNLLMNMAQLHTINVTPDLVRKAIKRYSKRFDLSADGHKVRWIGGKDNTEFSYEDEKAIEMTELLDHDSSLDRGTRDSSKRSQSNSTSREVSTSKDDSQDKTSGRQTNNESRQQQLTTAGASNIPISVGGQAVNASTFDYKPIVYRGRTVNLGLDIDHLKESSDSFDSTSDGSRGLSHALGKSNLKQKPQVGGIITFFNNPFFCSDFGADKTSLNITSARPAIAGVTLGIQPPCELVESALRYSDATYFTMHFAQPTYQPHGPNDPNLRFDLPDLAPIDAAGESEPALQDFEACGLGGVTPEDNFIIDVITEVKTAPRHGPDVAMRQLPFSKRKYLQRYLEKVVSCRKIQLLPSRLPPPSYIFFTSSSSSNVMASDLSMSSSGSNNSSSPFVDEEFPAPPAFLAQFSGGSGDNGADEEDGEDSSSIDMLDVARKMAPEHIAEQERVYLITQPDGARKAAAGSLAATVGASQSTNSVLGRLNAAVTRSGVGEVDNSSMMDENGSENEDHDLDMI